MKDYSPDFSLITDAAYNKKTPYIPLYEHNIHFNVVEQIIDRELTPLFEGDADEKKEFFHQYSEFCAAYGYDVIPLERCVCSVVQGGEALAGNIDGMFKSRIDVEAYPWEELPERYFRWADPYFSALEGSLKPGMKAVGGVGNGLFELVQDFMGFTGLSYLQADDPGAYELIFRKTGDALCRIWEIFMEKYGSQYAVLRFGDDLGFKTSTLLSPDDIRRHIIPQYKRIIDIVHRYDKPFLLHSCGMIFEVMDDIIDTAGIDAKHSNEDQIAPFSKWLDIYGRRIGNFGGIEMNILCQNTESEIKEYVTDVLKYSEQFPGVAIGSGNQIAHYVPPEGFIAMSEAVREYRGV